MRDFLHDSFFCFRKSKEKSKEKSKWYADKPILKPISDFLPAGISVKDPSIIFFDGEWHIFFTSTGKDYLGKIKYTISYTSSKKLEEINGSQRKCLSILSDETGYAAAPQIFYFEKQKLWYLIYQTVFDSRYTPVYSTTDNISDPHSWSKPQILAEKFEEDKWIDFWIICDNDSAYLFYTRNQKHMYYLKTNIDEFPMNFGSPKRLIGDIKVHEASMIYKIKNIPEYWLLTEFRPRINLRCFYLSKSPSLDGPWSKSMLFAMNNQLIFPNSSTRWSNVVSHGELIRSGYDQKIEIPSSEYVEFLIQGNMDLNERKYVENYWELGVIRNFKDVNNGQIFRNENSGY